GTASDLRDDLLGAQVGIVAVVRMTREDAFAARRRAEALRVERPADLERADAVDAVLAAAGNEHLLLIVALRERPAAERHADLVRTRRREETNILQPRVDLLHDAVLDLIVRAHVLLAADDRLVGRLAV